MSKKILVTGANGQLGRTLEELYFVNALGLDLTFVSKEVLDITSQIELENYFKHNSFNCCINCAAYTNVEQAEKTPEIAYKVNAEGVKNLAEICKKHDTILIHISTDYVFDGEKETPYTIDDTPNPINEYGKSKLLGEQHVRNLLDKYFIIRTSWLYSKNYDNNFYRSILKKAKRGYELKITVEQKGCPTDTVNLSVFIIGLIQGNVQNFGVYHFCDEEAMTWYDFAIKILEENSLYDKVRLVKAKNYRTFANRPKYSVLTQSI